MGSNNAKYFLFLLLAVGLIFIGIQFYRKHKENPSPSPAPQPPKPQPPAPEPPKPKNYVIKMKPITDGVSTRCITENENGKLVSSACTDSPNQKWNYDGSKLSSAVTGKCVAAGENVYDDGPSLETANCNDSGSRIVLLNYVNNRLHVEDPATRSPSDMCVNLPGRKYEDGTFLDLYPCDKAEQDTVTWIIEEDK